MRHRIPAYSYLVLVLHAKMFPMGVFSGYKIKSNLTEKQIEADVATYLGWISPPGDAPFRLLDIDEQLTGADKKLDLLIPVYMQFKVSHGLRPLKSLIPNLGYNRLQRIRNARHNTGLADDPTLYFKLRERAAHAEDFQHNILWRLYHITNHNAFYVAPLMLDKDKYYDTLYEPTARWLHLPYRNGIINVYDKHWISQYGFIPFLRAHISIPPLELVANANHHYSFSVTGDEILFHSPSSVPGVHRLSDELMRIYYMAYNGGNWVNAYEYKDVLEREFYRDLDRRIDNDPLVTLRQFGQELYRKWGIRQFFIAKRRDSK